MHLLSILVHTFVTKWNNVAALLKICNVLKMALTRHVSTGGVVTLSLPAGNLPGDEPGSSSNINESKCSSYFPRTTRSILVTSQISSREMTQNADR